MSKKALRFFVAGVIVLQVFFPFNASAQGNLLITPRRIVFEGNQRSIDLSLANIGQDTATYAISLIQIRMTEDGAFETINEPDSGQYFASEYLRFFPRSVTLGPKETQTVKVQLVKTNQLAPGEYRSHFYFRAVPKEKPLGEAEPVQDQKTITVVLKPVFGITIPAIVRSGVSSTKVTISDISLRMVNDTIPRLSLAFNRTGNFSVYGDLAVDYISPQGTVTRVGAANGIAVYTPNRIRRFAFNLNKVPGVDLKSGKLRLVFSAPSDVKPEKYTEAELILK